MFNLELKRPTSFTKENKPFNHSIIEFQWHRNVGFKFLIVKITILIFQSIFQSEQISFWKIRLHTARLKIDIWTPIFWPPTLSFELLIGYLLQRYFWFVISFQSDTQTEFFWKLPTFSVMYEFWRALLWELLKSIIMNCQFILEKVKKLRFENEHW